VHTGVRVSELGRAVHATIQAILPRAVAIGLTLDYLNSAQVQCQLDRRHPHKSLLTSTCISAGLRPGSQFTPKKAPETNRLTPGVLQLCTGTQLTVDETVLNEGRLESNGTGHGRKCWRLPAKCSYLCMTRCCMVMRVRRRE